MISPWHVTPYLYLKISNDFWLVETEQNEQIEPLIPGEMFYAFSEV